MKLLLQLPTTLDAQAEEKNRKQNTIEGSIDLLFPTSDCIIQHQPGWHMAEVEAETPVVDDETKERAEKLKGTANEYFKSELSSTVVLVVWSHIHKDNNDIDKSV